MGRFLSISFSRLLTHYAIWTLKNANFSHYLLFSFSLLFLFAIALVSLQIHFSKPINLISVVALFGWNEQLCLCSFTTKLTTLTLSLSHSLFVNAEKESNFFPRDSYFLLGLFCPHQTLLFLFVFSLFTNPFQNLSFRCFQHWTTLLTSFVYSKKKKKTFQLSPFFFFHCHRLLFFFRFFFSSHWQYSFSEIILWLCLSCSQN